MPKNWRSWLDRTLEDLRILEQNRVEAHEKFDQFCEFIAEPAFETLADELKTRAVRCLWTRKKGLSLTLRTCFPGSRTADFEYIIRLSKDAVGLSLVLAVNGRRTKKSPFEAFEMAFLDGLDEARLIKLDKEILIRDVIDRYRDFKFGASTPAK